MELQYLDLNYYFDRSLIMKVIGVSTTGSFVVNDLVQVFSISHEMARNYVIDWLLIKGVDSDELRQYFHKIEVSIKSERHILCFGVDRISVVYSTDEAIFIGHHRIITRQDGPMVEFEIANSNITSELNEIIFTNPCELMHKKFEMTITHMLDTPLVQRFHGCFLSNIEVKNLVDYDENQDYEDSSFNVSLKIKTDYSEVQ